MTAIDQFLQLKWEGDETADDILTGIYGSRKNIPHLQLEDWF